MVTIRLTVTAKTRTITIGKVMVKTRNVENKPKKEPENNYKGKQTILEGFLYETLASENPELNPKIMQAAVKRVLQDVKPEVLQQMEQEYARTVAYILKRQDGLV